MSVVYRLRPKVTEGNDTLDALYGVEYDECVRANDSIRSIFSNNFIKTANLDGVRKFEKIYYINERDDLGLEERREIVYSKMIYKPPFTRQRLNILLTNILGEGNFWFEINPTEFSVIVGIIKLDKTVYDKYIERIREIIPANMYLIPSTPYTYLYLSGMTYGNERTYVLVGTGNGDYVKISNNNYVYVGDGNGNYEISSDPVSTDMNKLDYYTYKELSAYSVFDTTVEVYSMSTTETYTDWPDTQVPVTSQTQGEIVTLAGTNDEHGLSCIGYVSEM